MQTFYGITSSWLFLLFCWHQGCFGATKQLTDEEKLLEHLFENYNPSARPVLNSSKTVTVGLRFALLQIQDLNVRSQVFTTTGLLILDWLDERLTWEDDVSTLNEIVINSKGIWKPEFAVINGAEGIYEDFSDFQAVLKRDGSIHWEPGGVFKTMCTIDITYYPFDSQTCDLKFGAWSYYTSKMNLTTNITYVGMDTYEKNGEWEIMGSAVNRDEFYFDCCPNERFSNIVFSINLRRRHTFYIMNVILPGIMTSAVLLSIFFCTPSQKVHIGVAALLSFRLFLLNVADTIPRTSDHVPLLGIYLTSTMAITTLAMVATVFVLNLYGMKEKPVPPWAKRVFVTYLARMLCMCDCIAPPEKSSSRDDLEMQYVHYTQSNPYVLQEKSYGYIDSTKNKTKRKGKGRYKLVATQDIEEKNGGVIEGDTPIGDSPCATPSHESYQSRDNKLSFDSPSSSANPSPVYRGRYSDQQNGENTHRRQRRRSLEQREKRIDFSKDWVHVAAVCDRLFFWFCFLFITATTLLLFHPLTTAQFFKIPMLENKS